MLQQIDPSALDRKKKTDFLVEFPDHFAIGSHVYLGQDAQTH